MDIKHFVGLGPGKAGTTFVYGYLSNHPEVSTGKIKESYFFTQNFDKGMDWYLDIKEIFKFNGSSSRALIGDISNQYFKDLSCLNRIEKSFPGTKYFFFERDPLDRLLSCYKFERKMGSSMSLDQYLRTQKREHFDNRFLLDKIHAVVEPDRVFVVSFKELVSDQNGVFQKVCSFLDICFVELDIPDFINPSVSPRYALLARWGRRVAVAFRQLGFYSALQKLKSNSLVRRFFFTSKVIVLSEAEVESARKFLSESQG